MRGREEPDGTCEVAEAAIFGTLAELNGSTGPGPALSMGGDGNAAAVFSVDRAAGLGSIGAAACGSLGSGFEVMALVVPLGAGRV